MTWLDNISHIAIFAGILAIAALVLLLVCERARRRPEILSSWGHESHGPSHGEDQCKRPT